MSFTILEIIEGVTVDNAAITSYYTAQPLTHTKITQLTCLNYSSAPATITLYLVTSGGSAGNATMITKNKILAAGETWSCPDLVGHVVSPSGTIRAQAGTANSINISASGIEMVN